MMRNSIKKTPSPARERRKRERNIMVGGDLFLKFWFKDGQFLPVNRQPVNTSIQLWGETSQQTTLRKRRQFSSEQSSSLLYFFR